MPKKNAKKNVRKIKQTRKQKKKSELKKKVRKVIREKFEDSSSDEVLYQAEREYDSSSSDSNSPKKKPTRRRNTKRPHTDSSSRSNSRSSSKSSSRSNSRSSSKSRSGSKNSSHSNSRSGSKSRSKSDSSSRSRSVSRHHSDSSSRSKSESNSERRSDTTRQSNSRRKSKSKPAPRQKEYSGSKVAPEESVIKDKEVIKQYMEDLAYPSRISRIKDEDLVPLDAPPKDENLPIDNPVRSPPRSPPKSPIASDVRPLTPPREDRQLTPPREDRQLTPPREERPNTPPRQRTPPREERMNTPPSEPDAPSKDDRKDFDESMLQSKFQYVYEVEDDVEPTEYFSSKKVEEFILGKGFMILEYFVVHGLCAFILIQLPAICETMMVYVNRKKFPIQVGESSYKKTTLEKLKIEKCEDDTYDYENMTLTGFDLSHTLDTIKETNQQQKSLAYYVYRQISRMMYVTKNIEIKPCILLHNIFGFYETYHIPERKPSKEFYPVISLETLFSKTFLLEQNIPVFYQRFYSIMNQSNRNKMEYLETSLKSILKKMDLLRQEVKDLQTKDNDKLRVKTIVDRLDKRVEEISKEKREIIETVTDRVAQSYQIKRLDDQHNQIDLKKAECNALYSEIKREYDKHVFHHELVFHELYYKMRDMESLHRYLE